MTLLGFKIILHKKCRSGKNSEGPAENSWVQQNENKFQKVCKYGWIPMTAKEHASVLQGPFVCYHIVWEHTLKNLYNVCITYERKVAFHHV
jgi:hypothetical protein